MRQPRGYVKVDAGLDAIQAAAFRQLPGTRWNALADGGLEGDVSLNAYSSALHLLGAWGATGSASPPAPYVEPAEVHELEQAAQAALQPLWRERLKPYQREGLVAAFTLGGLLAE